MIGWRARLGFLVPPGNPTVESEMIALAPSGVTVHFHRMTARFAQQIGRLEHGGSGIVLGPQDRRLVAAHALLSGTVRKLVKPLRFGRAQWEATR